MGLTTRYRRDSIKYGTVIERGGQMGQGQRNWPKMMLRLPPDAKRWIENEARKHGTSQNSEVLRSVRERMSKAKKTAPEGVAPPTEA